MQQVGARKPRPGELWLSRPPYLMLTHVLEVERDGSREIVTYELADEDGSCLERVDHAVLDQGWWRAFQPMTRRVG